MDLETVKAVLTNRMHVMRDYSRRVTLPVLRAEKAAAAHGDSLWKNARRLLVSRPALLDENGKARLGKLLDDHAALRTVHEFQEQLIALWEQANVSNEKLVAQLREWCARAEASGIEVLEDFAERLRGYVPAPVPA